MAELRHNDLNSLFTDIANALREKGASGNLVADNFDLAIKNISGGGSNLKFGTITPTTSGTTVKCGFIPEYIVICVNTGQTTYFGFGIYNNGTTTGSRYATGSSTSNTSPATIQVSDDGFTLTALSTNYSKDTFYVAFGNTSSGTKSMDLLWVNSSPSAAFAVQTITLNLSSYNGVIITHKNSYSDASVGYRTYVPIGEACRLDSGWTSSSRQTANRLCSVYSDRIEFQTGRTNTTNNNSYLIPIEIYGV